MRILKKLLRTLTVLCTAAVLCAAVSILTENGSGGTVFICFGKGITVEGAGAALAFLTSALFAALWLTGLHKRTGRPSGTGERLNDAGFGLLPAIAVWKIFEQATEFAQGKEVFSPLPQIPFLTKDGFFEPSRTEMICAVLCFTVLLIWLVARKKDLPGNGDLLLTAVSTWSLIRAMTETFRSAPFFTAGNINVMQILFFAAADLCLIIWTVRREKHQKSTAFTVLEWIAVLACETAVVLNTANILTAGSMIGDLAVNTGCIILCLLLVLLTGKDSRADENVISGSDSFALYS